MLVIDLAGSATALEKRVQMREKALSKGERKRSRSHVVLAQSPVARVREYGGLGRC